MFYVSEIFKDKPNKFDTELQEKVYATLEKLNIPLKGYQLMRQLQWRIVFL